MNPIGASTLAFTSSALQDALVKCRDWGYDCAELRIIDGQLVTPSLPAIARQAVSRAIRSAGLPIVTLATSTRLSDIRRATQELPVLLEIAAEWSAKSVRVFGGPVASAEPSDDELAAMRDVVVEALPLARSLGIHIVLETHDSMSSARHAKRLLDLVDDAQFGVIWDVCHTWEVGDPLEESWQLLRPALYELQIKDARRGTDGKLQLRLLGDGQVPWPQCVTAAVHGGFTGPIVVEWEKHWHPELEEPERALPQHLVLLRQHLAECATA